MKKHLYLSCMGTMGSGKTTAARLIAKKLRFRLVEENFGENVFLERFYTDMKRWAFHSQTFFLMEKISQMLETSAVLARHSVVQDTPIQQDALSYAKAQHVLGNMDDAEWRLYQKIYKSFEPNFPVPDLIIYLDATVPVLSDRVGKRGRGYEQKIPVSYLELLDMLNKRWLSENKTIPVMMVNTDGLNIVASQPARENFIGMIQAEIRKR